MAMTRLKPDLRKPPGTMLAIKGELSVPGDAARPHGGTGRHGNRKRFERKL